MAADLRRATTRLPRLLFDSEDMLFEDRRAETEASSLSSDIAGGAPVRAKEPQPAGTTRISASTLSRVVVASAITESPAP